MSGFDETFGGRRTMRAPMAMRSMARAQRPMRAMRRTTTTTSYPGSDLPAFNTGGALSAQAQDLGGGMMDGGDAGGSDDIAEQIADQVVAQGSYYQGLGGDDDGASASLFPSFLDDDFTSSFSDDDAARNAARASNAIRPRADRTGQPMPQRRTPMGSRSSSHRSYADPRMAVAEYGADGWATNSRFNHPVPVYDDPAQPATGEFWPAVKTGAGVGIGVLGAFFVVGMIARGIRR